MPWQNYVFLVAMRAPYPKNCFKRSLAHRTRLCDLVIALETRLVSPRVCQSWYIRRVISDALKTCSHMSESDYQFHTCQGAVCTPIHSKQPARADSTNAWRSRVGLFPKVAWEFQSARRTTLQKRVPTTSNAQPSVKRITCNHTMSHAYTE